VPASTRPLGSPRRLDIQGLRAVAVLSVVAFHAGLNLPGGFVGVDVFFVISGFVIAGVLARELGTYGHVSFRRFYGRRFKRLTPALALTVTVTLIFSILLESPFGAQQVTAATGMGAMLSVANVVIALVSGRYFAPAAESNPLLNTWSLSVEEQFYFIFPVLFVLAWRHHPWAWSPKAMITGMLSLAGLISFACCIVGWLGLLASPVGNAMLGFYSPVPRAWEFTAGALLFHLMERRRVRTGLAALCSWLGLVLLAVSFSSISDATAYPGPWTLVPVAATCLLLIGGSTTTSVVSRCLSTRPMVYLGDRSYSLYLWHWPLIVFAAALFPGKLTASLVAIAVSFVVALVTYRYVEDPIRRLTLTRTWSWARLVTATVIPPVVVAGILMQGANRLWWYSWPDNRDAQLALQVARNCVDVPFSPAQCTFGSAGTSGTVLVAGDSQAYAAADGILAAAEQLGMQVVVTSQSGCPFTSGGVDPATSTSCLEWQQEVLSYVARERPAAVVVANRSAGYVNREWNWVPLVDSEGRSISSSDEAEGVWQASLSRLASSIAEYETPVLVLSPIPDLDDRGDSRSLFDLWVRGGTTATPKANREEYEAARARAVAAERRVAAESRNVLLVDPAPILCGVDHCPRMLDKKPIYLDWGHLNRDGSLALSALWHRALRESQLLRENMRQGRATVVG
jgi:peptidoglycan/LPS O-acetylase OafA/YrhL